MQISVTPVMEFEGAAVIFLFLPTMSCSDSILLIKSVKLDSKVRFFIILQFFRLLIQLRGN